MTSSLIQNYIASRPVSQTVPAFKAEPNGKPAFDIQQELDNRTFIKPLKGKGRLVRGNIFNAPKMMFDDVIYDVKAFKHAMKGEANDHELGKLNDVGLMLGGLGIASYLMTKRITPMTKSMEFVGFGAFLASMALWPKIAIQLPAYLIHGVNVQKEYIDSFGRRKNFYQDPQFIPWDLYSDEEIDKIGDRLNVPKDIPNRRDFTQEKMRKLAIQNNTLWMLTAGLATPIMTGLACNSLEAYIKNQANKINNKKADEIISNIGKASEKYKTKYISEDFQKIIKDYNGKPVTPELLDLIAETFTQDIDSVSTESFKRDLAEFVGTSEYSVNENTAREVSKSIKETLKGSVSEEFISAIVPSEEEMVALFKNNNFMEPTKEIDFSRIQTAIIKEISHRYVNLENKDVDAAKFKQLRTLILNNKQETHPIQRVLGSVRAKLFDSSIQETLKGLAEIFDNFRAKNLALDEYALIKTGAAPETVIANYWNDVSKTMIKEFGITQKELEKVKFDKTLMGNLLREKIETIVSDKTKYDRVMTKLAEKIASIDGLIKSSDISAHMLKGDIGDSNSKTAYETAVDNVFDEVAAALRKEGFSETAEAIAGKGLDTFGSYKNIQKAFVEERLLGVKSSFNRLINAMDFFRRVATNPNAFTPYENRYLPREIREELIEICKCTLLEGHSSDFATKLYMLRNPNPNLSDTTAIEIVGGKIKYKYVGNPEIARSDIPGDKCFFQDAMKYMFEDEMHSDTKSILEKVRLDEEVTKYRNLILEKIGGDGYFWKPRHLNRPKVETGSDIKFLLTGISPQEFFFKSGQEFYNTKTWLKMFGTIGAGLLGATVLIQFFLGRMKNPKKAGQQ